jgi:hypothetical protein
MQRSELVECFPLLRCQPSIKFHYRRTQAMQRLQRGRAEPFDVFETLGEGRQRTGLKSGRGQCRTSLPDRFDRVARTRAELVPRRELRVRKRQFYAAKGESARKQRVEVAANPPRRTGRPILDLSMARMAFAPRPARPASRSIRHLLPLQRTTCFFSSEKLFPGIDRRGRGCPARFAGLCPARA